MGYSHTPVMLTEAMSLLAVQPGGIYLDCTFGSGGYTRAMLELGAGMVYALDCDSNNYNYYLDVAASYPGRTVWLHQNFSTLSELQQNDKTKTLKFDGIVFDLGISSVQLDDPARGLSFMRSGPLDMRLDLLKEGRTAADFLHLPEKEMADLIYQLGDEGYSRRIAKSIKERMKQEGIEDTVRLAEAIRKVVPRKKIDPATKTFQAIRIWVNDELGALAKGLESALSLLAEEGRMVVVAFHGLEDKIVKEAFRRYSKQDQKIYCLINKKVLQSSREEVRSNPRSRSAKMRGLVKCKQN